MHARGLNDHTATSWGRTDSPGTTTTTMCPIPMFMCKRLKIPLLIFSLCRPATQRGRAWPALSCRQGGETAHDEEGMAVVDMK